MSWGSNKIHLIGWGRLLKFYDGDMGSIALWKVNESSLRLLRIKIRVMAFLWLMRIILVLQAVFVQFVFLLSMTSTSSWKNPRLQMREKNVFFFRWHITAQQRERLLSVNLQFLLSEWPNSRSDRDVYCNIYNEGGQGEKYYAVLRIAASRHYWDFNG
jgi:hypothetical protein